MFPEMMLIVDGRGLDAAAADPHVRFPQPRVASPLGRNSHRRSGGIIASGDLAKAVKKAAAAAVKMNGYFPPLLSTTRFCFNLQPLVGLQTG